MIRTLILLAVIASCYSFQIRSSSLYSSRSSGSSRSSSIIVSAKGFGKKNDRNSDSDNAVNNNKRIDGKELSNKTFIPFSEGSDSDSSSSNVDTTNTVISDSEISSIDNNDDANIEKLAKKYGLGAGSETPKKKKKEQVTSSSGDKPFGEDVITKIPLELQGKIDNILIAGVFLSLAWCILCGVGMSAGSLKIVFKDFQLANTIDGLIVNVFDPSFTPSIGIFFFFSITFGLFKYAQIQSSQTAYKE